MFMQGLLASRESARRGGVWLSALPLAALLLCSPGVSLAQEPGGGEANLILPDLAQATFLGGINGRTLLM